jgi:hypothetical protein
MIASRDCLSCFAADGIDIVKEELIRPVHRLSGSVREKTLSDKNQAGTRWHFFPVSGLFPAWVLLRNDQTLKGFWRMPWRREAMKDVASCDKNRGGASTLWSGYFRMGKPTFTVFQLRSDFGQGGDWRIVERYNELNT